MFFMGLLKLCYNISILIKTGETKATTQLQSL